MIGFIDSGVGGINVLAECSKIFNEDFIYLCDNKNAPYGNKSKKKLYKITKNNIDYLIEKYNVDIVVLACNTLSFCVGKKIKKEYSIPIILMQMNENKINKLKKDVLFFATKNTIKNNNIINKPIFIAFIFLSLSLIFSEFNFSLSFFIFFCSCFFIFFSSFSCFAIGKLFTLLILGYVICLNEMLTFIIAGLSVVVATVSSAFVIVCDCSSSFHKI